MRVKDTSGASVKAGPSAGLPEGSFQAYASVFGNVDSYGDRVLKGAFEKDLKRWGELGMKIPLLFGHNMSDPDFNIGHIESAAEDEKGLLVNAVLDLENPKAKQVYRMLKGGRVNQMSFAYDVLDSEMVKSSPDAADDDPKIQELKELKVYEVSVVTIGANQETEILAVKAAANALMAKAGREWSEKDETSIRSIRDQMASAVDALSDFLTPDEQEEAEEKTSEQAAEGNSEPDEETVDDRNSGGSEETSSQKSSVLTDAQLKIYALRAERS